jgi:hypothetical protein
VVSSLVAHVFGLVHGISQTAHSFSPTYITVISL